MKEIIITKVIESYSVPVPRGRIDSNSEVFIFESIYNLLDKFDVY